MNCLQKLLKLLESENRTIVCGIPRETDSAAVVSLSVGESEESTRALADKRRSNRIVVNIDVYADDYISGFDILLAVREEIETAVKSSVNIFFAKFGESGYDERLGKHILRSQYKIIE